MFGLNQRFVRSFRRTTPSATVLALINAGLVSFANLLLSPFLISLYVWISQGTDLEIALPFVLWGAAWALSSPVQSFLARRWPPGRWLAASSALLRVLALWAAAWVTWFENDLSSLDRIDVVLISYAIFAAASAFNLSTLRGLIAATRAVRASELFATQRWLGACCTVVAGLVVFFALRTENVSPERAIAGFILLAAVSISAATWFQFMTTLSAIRAADIAPSHQSSAISALGSPALRRLVMFRLMLGASMLIEPFLLVFGWTELGFSPRYVGSALIAYAAGHTIVATVTHQWMLTSPPRNLMVTATGLRLSALVGILALPDLASTTAYTEQFDSMQPIWVAFVAMFLLLGWSASLAQTGTQQYVVSVAAPQQRAAAISMINLVLGVAAFSPLVGVYLLDQYSMQTVIIVAAAVAFAALLISGFLFEPKPHVARVRGSWRQRTA